MNSVCVRTHCPSNNTRTSKKKRRTPPGERAKHKKEERRKEKLTTNPPELDGEIFNPAAASLPMLSRSFRCFSTASGRLIEKPQRSFPLSIKSELVSKFNDISNLNKSNTSDLKNAFYGLRVLNDKQLTKAIVNDFIDSKKDIRFINNDPEALTLILQCLKDCEDKTAGKLAIKLYNRVESLTKPAGAAATTTSASSGESSSLKKKKASSVATSHLPNEQHATVLLSVLRSAGLVDEGLRIYKDIINDEIRYPGAASNSILANSALRLYTSCSGSRLRDDHDLFNSALDLFNSSKSAISKGVQKQQREGGGDKSTTKETTAQTTAGEVHRQKAEEEEEISVHASNYGTMLLLAGRAQRMDVVDRLWDEMTKQGMHSTVYGLTARMTALMYFPVTTRAVAVTVAAPAAAAAAEDGDTTAAIVDTVSPPPGGALRAAATARGIGDVVKLGLFPEIVSLYREVLRLGMKPSIQTLQVALNACQLYGFPGLGMSLFIDWERVRGGTPDWQISESILRLMGASNAYPPLLKDVPIRIAGVKKLTGAQFEKHCDDAFSRIYPIISDPSVLRRHIRTGEKEAVRMLATQMILRGNIDFILSVAEESAANSTLGSEVVVQPLSSLSSSSSQLLVTAAAQTIGEEGRHHSRSATLPTTTILVNTAAASSNNGSTPMTTLIEEEVWLAVATEYVNRGRWRDLLALIERLKSYNYNNSKERTTTGGGVRSVYVSTKTLADITEKCVGLLSAKGLTDRAAKLQASL